MKFPQNHRIRSENAREENMLVLAQKVKFPHDKMWQQKRRCEIADSKLNGAAVWTIFALSLINRPGTETLLILNHNFAAIPPNEVPLPLVS